MGIYGDVWGYMGFDATSRLRLSSSFRSQSRSLSLSVSLPLLPLLLVLLSRSYVPRLAGSYNDMEPCEGPGFRIKGSHKV